MCGAVRELGAPRRNFLSDHAARLIRLLPEAWIAPSAVRQLWARPRHRIQLVATGWPGRTCRPRPGVGELTALLIPGRDRRHRPVRFGPQAGRLGRAHPDGAARTSPSARTHLQVGVDLIRQRIVTAARGLLDGGRRRPTFTPWTAPAAYRRDGMDGVDLPGLSESLACRAAMRSDEPQVPSDT
jgi:hypothetical protein